MKLRTWLVLAFLPVLSTAFAAEPPAPQSSEAARIIADMRASRDLVKRGLYQEALAELFSVYDSSAKSRELYTRRTIALVELSRLAKVYPPAATLLKQRREEYRQELISGKAAHDAAREFDSLSWALDDGGAAYALYQSLPATHANRRLVEGIAYSSLVRAKRYREALQLMPYPGLKMLDSINDPRSYERHPEARRARMRQISLEAHATHVEILAGAGDTLQAQELINALLQLDSSDRMKGVIARRLAAAGHPELLDFQVPSGFRDTVHETPDPLNAP